jgi:hypothetical protein
MKPDGIRKIWQSGGAVLNGRLSIADSFGAEIMAAQGYDRPSICGTASSIVRRLSPCFGNGGIGRGADGSRPLARRGRRHEGARCRRLGNDVRSMAGAATTRVQAFRASPAGARQERPGSGETPNPSY